MASLEPGGFCSSDKLPANPASYIDELEGLVRAKDVIIAAQEEEIAKLQSAPRQSRGPSEDLKVSERLILLARINDLTVERNAIELDLLQRIKKLETVIDTYLAVNPEIFGDNEISLLVRGGAKKRALAAEDYGARLLDLENWCKDLENRCIDDSAIKRTAVTAQHLDRLADVLAMKARQGQKGVTYAEAGKILHLDKTTIIKLRTVISSDHRFNIEWHPNRRNMKIICLRR